MKNYSSMRDEIFSGFPNVGNDQQLARDLVDVYMGCEL